MFVQRVMVDVGVPSGKYSDTRPLNIDNHFVVVNPYYAFTYERKKVEFRARLHYLWNSINNDPFAGSGIKSMQPGIVSGGSARPVAKPVQRGTDVVPTAHGSGGDQCLRAQIY